jgi:hypothetical protein
MVQALFGLAIVLGLTANVIVLWSINRHLQSILTLLEQCMR